MNDRTIRPHLLFSGLIVAAMATATVACAPIEDTAAQPSPVSVEQILGGPTAAPATVEIPETPAMSVSQSNAVEKAQSYLSFTGFSRAGLIDQLTSAYGEGFPAEDAEFAVAHLESTGQVDWNTEAVEKAESYLEFTSFSRDGLIDQLTSEYGEQFTYEQAVHAANAVGL